MYMAVTTVKRLRSTRLTTVEFVIIAQYRVRAGEEGKLVGQVLPRRAGRIRPGLVPLER
jgi:hypothetical protein